MAAIRLRKSGLTVNERRFFFRANIEVESAYNPKARSHVGAIGLGYHARHGRRSRANPHDMHQNLDGSARHPLSAGSLRHERALVLSATTPARKLFHGTAASRRIGKPSATSAR